MRATQSVRRLVCLPAARRGHCGVSRRRRSWPQLSRCAGRSRQSDALEAGSRTGSSRAPACSRLAVRPRGCVRHRLAHFQRLRISRTKIQITQKHSEASPDDVYEDVDQARQAAGHFPIFRRKDEAGASGQATRSSDRSSFRLPNPSPGIRKCSLRRGRSFFEGRCKAQT